LEHGTTNSDADASEPYRGTRRSWSPAPEFGSGQLFFSGVFRQQDRRDVNAQRSGQGDGAVLLVEQNYANVLGYRVFLQLFALMNALAAVADGFGFVLQVELQDFLGFRRGADRFGMRYRHAAKIINLIGNDQCVAEFLGRALFEFGGDVHIFRALQDLRINYVRYDGLIFPGQILVEQRDQALTSQLRTGVGVLFFFPLYSPRRAGLLQPLPSAIKTVISNGDEGKARQSWLGSQTNARDRPSMRSWLPANAGDRAGALTLPCSLNAA
jgi:hypothetical protein